MKEKELDYFLKNIDVPDNPIFDTNFDNDYFSFDELMSKYYNKTLSKKYLKRIIEELPAYDIVDFISNILYDVNFLDLHMQKEQLEDSEKQKYELKLDEKNDRIRKLNENIIELNENISNLQDEIYSLNQNKRIIYKAASRINKEKSLLIEIDSIMQEETFEDQFKSTFDAFTKELIKRRENYKINSKK
jgi:hypothetical protein